MNEKQRRQIEFIDQIYNKVVLKKEETQAKGAYYQGDGKENFNYKNDCNKYPERSDYRQDTLATRGSDLKPVSHQRFAERPLL